MTRGTSLRLSPPPRHAGSKPAPAPHLIAQHGHGAGGGDLGGAEPDGSDAGGQPQDEDLRDGAHGLRRHGERVAAGCQAGALEPRAQRVQPRAQQRREAQAAGVQQPGGGQDERHVGHHVHHGEPVYLREGHAVEVDEDVAKDAVLDPLESVHQRVAAEHGQHRQPPPRQPRLRPPARPGPGRRASSGAAVLRFLAGEEAVVLRGSQHLPSLSLRLPLLFLAAVLHHLGRLPAQLPGSGGLSLAPPALTAPRSQRSAAGRKATSGARRGQWKPRGGARRGGRRSRARLPPAAGGGAEGVPRVASSSAGCALLPEHGGKVLFLHRTVPVYSWC